MRLDVKLKTETMKILLLISLLCASPAFSQVQTQSTGTNTTQQPSETQKNESKAERLTIAPDPNRKTVKAVSKKESPSLNNKEQ